MADHARVVAVSTNPAIDRIALAPAAAGGGLVRAQELLETPGGKATHVAMVAAALGAGVRLVALGGPVLEGLLDAAGVPATLVPAATPTRGTYTVVDPAAGDVLEVHEPSPPLSSDECEALVTTATEAAALLGESTGDGSLPATARALRDRGARAAWLSAGPHGSVLAGENGAWRLAAAAPARVVNAVGCGDALVGGLAAGLERGLALLDAAVLGVAAATDKLAHLHSGRVEREAVEALVPAVSVEAIG
jgi:fructose-1-phosphate kinase PfkB-like protein